MAHAAPRNAPFTLSAVYGTERRRVPVASNTAFEIADGTTAALGSPAPQGFSVGRSTNSMMISGTSGKVENRIACPIEARHPGPVELKLLLERSTHRLGHVAFDLVLEAIRIDDLPAVVDNIKRVLRISGLLSP